MEMRQEKSWSVKKAVRLQPPVLGWLLLGVWLGYSALMLWHLEAANTIATASMCITRR